jgi:hypothetical protein
MKVRVAAALLIVATVSAAPVWANEWHGAAGSAQSAPAVSSKPKSFNLAIKMLEDPGFTSGACTSGAIGYANYCASGSCDCYSYSGTANGAAGKAIVAFFETYDYGTEYDFSNYGCASAYGEIDVIGTKDTLAIAFVGADCFSNFAPPYLTGGCMLGDDLNGAQAAGPCSGLYSDSKVTTFKIKAKGIK